MCIAVWTIRMNEVHKVLPLSCILQALAEGQNQGGEDFAERWVICVDGANPEQHLELTG